MPLSHLALVCLSLVLMVSPLHSQVKGTIGNKSFEVGRTIGNPWLGLNSQENVTVFTGTALTITEFGGVDTRTEIPPSVRAVDLNQDGLLDLVVADGLSYLWVYQNIGTPKEPLFRRGEIQPFMAWLPEYWRTLGGMNIDLGDMDGDGRPDLVWGSQRGILYWLRNQGSIKNLFQFPSELKHAEVKFTENPLPFSYLAPCVYDWNGDGSADLIAGDGTYATNNIYLYLNKGGGQKYEAPQILLRGEGRQFLTPVVMDWNNDKKPDLLVGARDGTLMLYLNTSANPKEYAFAPAQVVKIGSADRSGAFLRPALADLNGDGLLDLILPSSTGQVRWAPNTGKIGAPVFGTITPLKGQYTKETVAKKIMIPDFWDMGRAPYGFYLQMFLVSNDPADPVTYDKDFQPASPESGKRSLKITILKPADLETTGRIDVPSNLNVTDLKMASEVGIAGNGIKLGFPAEKKYVIRFNYRNEGFTKSLVRLKAENDTADKFEFSYEFPINNSGGWAKFEEKLNFKGRDLKATDVLEYSLNIIFAGQGTAYLDDISVEEVK